MENKKKKLTAYTEKEADNPEPQRDKIRGKRRHLPKNQTVIINSPTENLSYSEMVKEVKETVCKETPFFDITTRNAKSGNLILETAKKEDADELA